MDIRDEIALSKRKSQAESSFVHPGDTVDDDCLCVFQVVNENVDVECPIVEMTTRSKLSCLSWNKYTKSHIESSDYEGIVTVWDSVMEYEEHEKRAWSVDFSYTEPTLLISGSDDCKVLTIMEVKTTSFSTNTRLNYIFGLDSDPVHL
ncbi:hypothetical protein CTI12_AA221300 [Artemisia annua]|uniref:Uncharacterized protein n=1 Tax=Artemisia annua TaxID=35608 RepID=A0A2U1NWS9_ARTAN|nr:hypothetical protein CTI12_AA221300 [Artemisia annua]